MHFLQCISFVGLMAIVLTLTPTGGQDSCSDMIKEFRECLKKSRQPADNEIKAKIEECFTDNGCKVPAATKPKGNNSGEKNTDAAECRKAVAEATKALAEKCMRKKDPTFSFPDDAGEHGEHPKRNRPVKHSPKVLEEACGKGGKPAAVKACLAQLRPEKVDEKTAFDDLCKTKLSCETALGACKSKMEQLEQALCECTREQQTGAAQAAIRTSVKACANMKAKKAAKDGQANRKCGAPKNYCQLGFDAWVADHKGKNAGKHA